MMKLLALIGHLVQDHPKKIIASIFAMTLLLGFGLTKIQVDLSQGTLISKSDPLYKTTEQYNDNFGGDTLFILLSGNQDEFLSPNNLSAINKLQEKLVKKDEIQSSFSYYDLIESGVEQTNTKMKDLEDQLKNVREAATKEAIAAGATSDQQAVIDRKATEEFLKRLQAQSGTDLTALSNIGKPSIDNTRFVEGLVFDNQGNVNQMFDKLMPQNGEYALIIMKVKGGIPYDELSGLTKEVTSETSKIGLTNLETTISGTPKIYGAIYNSMVKDMSIMLSLSLVLMLVILFIVFPVRWRLLSIPVVFLSLIWTLGIMGYIGVPMSMVTMAILPILIGLGTDFAIQFHNRYDEELRTGASPKEAVIFSVKKMGIAVGIAVFSMTLGFITLLISKVPMIQHFGIMLSVGVIVSYTVSLLLMYSIFILRDRDLTPQTKLTPSKMEGFMKKLALVAVKKPILLLTIGIFLAAGGFFVDSSLKIETNIEKLMPQDAPELKELNDIRQIIGSTNEISFILKADDVTNPQVIQALNEYEEQQLEKHNQIESVTSIATLIKQANQGEIPESKSTIKTILSQIPSELKGNLLSTDNTLSSVSFTIKETGMKEQALLLNQLEEQISMPQGVSLEPAGSNVINIKSVGTMTENRHLSVGIGVLAIVIGLLLVYRRWKLTMYSILPIVLVVGWSSLMMFTLDIEINPLTAVLGSLVLGIGSEFTILIIERYQEEREKGLSSESAIVHSISMIGRAITASGLTVMAGFSTLIFSQFVMLRSFGITTVLDTFLCLISALFILPSLVVLFEKRARKQ
ncbi:hydrophobe/amphiphile efflux-3 (HAE3) family transporter [Exiguobacterium acetylicum]|uniref:efflux RND transporter permease subunit n=1 Tax=Exiguobacterium acetylicum TaxID=41170 RepID=UPI003977ADB6